MPSSIMTYSSVHLKPWRTVQVPTLAPERSGPLLSSREYRAAVVTPVMNQRLRVITVKKSVDHPVDNTPTQYSRITFDEQDTIVTFGPWWGHKVFFSNGCCSSGRHICHNTDTWLSRKEFTAIANQRLIDEEKEKKPKEKKSE